MSDFIKDIRNNLAFVGTKILHKKVDCKEIGRKLDLQIENGVDKAADDIQVELLHAWFEIIEGMFEDNIVALRDEARVWLNNLAHLSKKGG